jgi:hypothetical protein
MNSSDSVKLLRDKVLLQEQLLKAQQKELWAKMVDREATSEVESAKIFFFKFAKTFDPHDEKHPIKHFPEKDYIHKFIETWVGTRLLAVSKSRQMLGTWLCVTAYAWDSYRHDGRFTIFKSVDRKRAGLEKLSLLWRAKHIHDNLPSCVRPRITVKRKDQMLIYPDTNGAILAMSMEGDDSVSYTATGVLDDELAVQQYGEAGFTAVQPLLGETGRYTAISTPRGENFWWRLTHDHFDD